MFLSFCVLSYFVNVFFVCMHCIELSHASHSVIFLKKAHTSFRLGGGLAAYLTTFSQGLSLCKPQLFAECLDW